MKKRIISKSEDSGITSYFKKQGDQIIVENHQDTSGHAQVCKELREKNNGASGDFHLLASIPKIFINKWTQELGGASPLKKENRDFLIAKINSSEFSDFKTTNGRA
tara:strand:+ start:2001 stop:2318 length:318 start_codon:yes stop_codon:yes gene_type:complete